MKSSNIGGQAVMEGIMMRHKDKYSIAVRRPDKEIELKVEDYKCIFGNAKFLKYPLIRGVVSFVDSLVIGTKCLMYSAEIAGDEEDEEEAEDAVPLTASWRRLFAYVPQGNQLMSGTIREILTFRERKEMQEEKRIWQALRIADAEGFVRAFPDGIDTVLGEHGMGLSEGQMQRIAIARAIFAGNPILLLDESTSALDEETERTILKNLQEMTDKTIMIVTHRKAVLDICDREICFSEKQVLTKVR